MYMLNKVLKSVDSNELSELPDEFCHSCSLRGGAIRKADFRTKKRRYSLNFDACPIREGLYRKMEPQTQKEVGQTSVLSCDSKVDRTHMCKQAIACSSVGARQAGLRLWLQGR